MLLGKGVESMKGTIKEKKHAQKDILKTFSCTLAK